jgi:hypothetical protein
VILALVLCGSGLAFAFSFERLSVSNTSLVLRYPTSAGLGLLSTGAGLLVGGAAFRRTLARVPLVGLGAIVLLVGADRMLFRLEAGPQSLTEDGLLGRTTIPWSEVRRVEPGSSVVVLWGRGDTQIRVVTDWLSPDDRAVIDRTIARHVREARPVK